MPRSHKLGARLAGLLRHGGLVLLAVIFILAACGKKPLSLPPQRWDNVIVRVETRPSPPEPGMNEFLIIANDLKGRPAHDMVISLRTADDQKWYQAIQDGHVGVFRRAIPLKKMENAVLQVQLKRGDKQKVLTFSLIPPAAANPT